MSKKKEDMTAEECCDIMAITCCNLLNSVAKIPNQNIITGNTYKILLLVDDKVAEFTRDDENMFREWEVRKINPEEVGTLRPGWNRISLPVGDNNEK